MYNQANDSSQHFALTLVVIVFIVYVQIAKALWHTSQTLLPNGGNDFGMAIGAYNDTIFLLGGYDNARQKQLTQYKVSTQTLTAFGLNTFERNLYGSVQYWTQQDHILYMVDPSTRNSLNTYDMIDKQLTVHWMGITFNNYVGTRSCLSSTPDHLYVSGGLSKYSPYYLLNHLQIVSLSTYEWISSPPSMSTNRSVHACIVHNSYLWVIGGNGHSSVLASIERIEITDITNNEWHFVSDLSLGLTGHGVVAWNDVLYVLGGSSYKIDYFGNAVKLVHSIDATTGAVTLSPHRLPYACVWTSPIIYDNILYVFGSGMGSNRDRWAYYPLAPTPQPTPHPTADPSTQSPTVDPSTHPITRTPTADPSTHPTEEPTDNPLTQTPTVDPSTDPTEEPSFNPIIAAAESTDEPRFIDSQTTNTETPTEKEHASDRQSKENESSTDILLVVILIAIGAIVLVGCCFYMEHRKHVQNNQKMVQKEVQQDAAVVNNKNIIDEDERMENVEDSIDSLYVNKHANQETTTGCTVDGSNQGSTQVRLRTTGLRTR
eukprot:1050642_1